MTALLLLAALAPQTTWYVDASATAPGDGTQASPYVSIGYSMAQPSSVTGDTISVAPGTYVDEQIDFAGKDIHLVSQGGAAQTIVIPPSPIQGVDNSTVRFENGEGHSAVLEGFRFTGGRGSAFAQVPSWATAGGAVFIDQASPTIRGCEFDGCPADHGGAIYMF